MTGTLTPGNSAVSELDTALEPCIALHWVWWKKLIARTGALGWWRCAILQYHIMEPGISLLPYSASRASVVKGRSMKKFIEWAVKHEREESEHPSWLRADLECAQISAPELERPPADLPLSGIMSETLGHIALGIPEAVLGYCYAMEGFPSNRSSVLELAGELEIPSHALRTILLHSDIDPRHGDEIRSLIESCATDPTIFSAITESAMSYYLRWATVLRILTERG